ncbi:MAG TPA: ATP-dependent DNA helicase RecG [Gaiellales bacterium]|nr:ATP-dependent DNA helicase RecG [Gaiellales bacterium]
MSRTAFAGLPLSGAPPRPVRAPRPSHLDQPVPGDRRLRSALASLRPRPVVTIGDLLEHVPFRHEDFREARRMADMQPGEEATIVATVIDVRQRPTRRRNLVIVEARVRDASGPGVVIWFNQRYVARQLSPGTVISVRGERRASIGAEIAAKSHEVMEEGDDAQHTSGLVPIYRATENLSSRRIRTLVDEQLGHAGDAPDALPSEVRGRHRLPLRRDAIVAAHRPRTPRDAERARRRLAFEELFLLQVGLIRHRRELESAAVAPALGRPGELSAGLLGTLPFTPTAAQIRAMAEVDGDVARTIPMQRLLQGDVGAGKTVVAVHALLRAVEHGGQGALMAPTETLSSQHLLSISALCEPLGVRVTPLVNGMPARKRRAALQMVESGEPQIVVGTHALIQDAVVFGRLEVAVVDEQHRFGVDQRRALEEKARDTGHVPHVLHMTATPIPRTLALTVYGDLDVSLLDELPPGRTPVVTRLVSRRRRGEVFTRMRRLLDEGRQAYVVCPLVSESAVAEATAAETEARRLAEGELRGYRVEVMHGQMPVAERRAVMQRFRAGELQVLVATTVIEVGVDVPNAVLMVIEEADRFGLAQLHQLRGRVGRGAYESYCLLLADPVTDDGRQRLEAMVRTTDGFELAEVDLELRGEGSLLAARQSGIPDLRHARLSRHRRLAMRARQEALRHLDADPQLRSPASELMLDQARRLFGEEIGWLTRA